VHDKRRDTADCSEKRALESLTENKFTQSVSAVSRTFVRFTVKPIIHGYSEPPRSTARRWE